MALSLAAVVAPAAALACACGCGVFDVGTSSMLPEGTGGTAYFEYNYQDQNHNWSGSSKAAAADNNDKEIRTHFYTAGMQYMFDRSWGTQIEVPYVDRHFKAAGNDGSVAAADWGQLGDIRVKGIYTGFSPDLSSGVDFGLKLPTGSFSQKDSAVGIDRDTQIGSGSTDLLLGGFHRGSLDDAGNWTGFAQAQLGIPVLIQDQYRPGVEMDAAAGAYYNSLSLGSVKISPVAQVVASERTRDTGAHSADPVASGYQRVFLSPGIEIHAHPFAIYADIELPVYQRFTGNQLAAPALFKIIVGYMF